MARLLGRKPERGYQAAAEAGERLHHDDPERYQKILSMAGAGR
jgi:hypothetical protein